MHNLFWMKAAWLADLDYQTEMDICDINEVNSANVIYTRLDIEMASFVPATYGKQNFLLMSGKLDRRMKA